MKLKSTPKALGERIDILDDIDRLSSSGECNAMRRIENVTEQLAAFPRPATPTDIPGIRRLVATP